MSRKGSELIWNTVDRCIFLEDDQIPAVSFFRYCAELLEKYKDDPRIEMICGHNPHVTYEDALPNDYFFTTSGWSIWGTAFWKRTAPQREYPFDYADNAYIKRCLKDNLSDFWYKKVEGYCNGKLVNNHAPGNEYYHAINSVLYHRMSIMPTRNMICNIGYQGAHANYDPKGKKPIYLAAQTYEIDFPIKHPKYVVDDKHYGREYAKLVGHVKPNPVVYFFMRISRFFSLLFSGRLISTIRQKLRPEEEK